MVSLPKIQCYLDTSLSLRYLTEAGGENKDERELTTQDCKTDAFQSEKINGRLINLRVVLFIFDILRHFNKRNITYYKK